MRNTAITLVLLAFAALLVACEGESAISRTYRCAFIFDTSIHPQPCHLTALMGNPGHFAKVETYLSGGVRHLKTTRNYDGATEDIMLRTEKERQTLFALGADNCIIVGTSAYDNALAAYDGQCPNCLNEYAGYAFPLTWTKNGTQLHCAKCLRTYDVNNGAVASGSGGRGLLVYNATFDGTLIRAWN